MNKQTSKASGAFFTMPKNLFSSPEYSALSVTAKVLFGLMLDRMSLSEKNGWRDADGETFIYFSIEQINENLGCSSWKTANCIRELENNSLIKKKKCGQGKPTMYYIIDKKVIQSPEYKNRDNLDSRNEETSIQETRKPASNKTENNNTELSNTNPLIPLEEEIKENIEYDYLVTVERKTDVDNIVGIICDTLSDKREYITVYGQRQRQSDVAERFRQLNENHISYVLELLNENRTKIRDIRAYVQKLLYNAPVTMDLYYTAKVARDLGLDT